MCSSKAKTSVLGGVEASSGTVARLNGRAVLQPATASLCNRTVPTLERRNSLKTNSSSKIPPSIFVTTTTSPPVDVSNISCINTNIDVGNGGVVKSTSPVLDRKKSKSFKETSNNSLLVSTGNANEIMRRQQQQQQLLPSTVVDASLSYSSALITESPGSIAAVRREHMALQHAQRKMRIAHYGRSKSAKFLQLNELNAPSNPLDLVATTLDNHPNNYSNNKCMNNNDIGDDHGGPEKLLVLVVARCSFITPNSDPIYVAYHDQEWGVPAHDDRLLFELLVLSGAQVGSDWASTLRKRQDYRDAFSRFDPETVANMSEKQMQSISTRYGIDLSRIRGVVDNSNRILEVKEAFGSFDKYIWGFVNKKPIQTNYKFGHKVPVKTSKSESISKDMIRRGFRFVGPTVVHSFLQAAGLTNDHLISCHRHLQCALLADAPFHN